MSAKYTYAELMASIHYLEQEGFIERIINEKGEEMIRICEGAEHL
jgi:hypothetical protein